MKQTKITHLWLFQLLADFAAVVVAYYMTLALRFHSAWGTSLFTTINRVLGVRETGALGQNYELFYTISAPRIILLITVTVCLLYALRDLYPGRRFVRPHLETWDIIIANALALALFYAYFYLRRNVFHPRSFFATALFLNVFLCIGFRGIAVRFLDSIRSKWGFDRHPAVVLGTGDGADYIHSVFEVLRPHGFETVARVDYDPEAEFASVMSRLKEEIAQQDADLVVAADERFTVAQIMQILELAAETDVSVKVLSDRLDVLASRARIPVDDIRGVPLVHFERPSVGSASRRLRQWASLAATWFLCILSLPLMGAIALLIKATSRGPVFFMQERVGINRKPFRMFKFRTMRERSDEMQAQMEEFNETSPALFKMKKDPRVTAVGHLLRRFSLDELPQLFNVIRREMTLVGPRPLPLRDFEGYYEDWHYVRHEGIPGMTCLWQVSGRSDLDFHNMCILDVYYLRNQGWIMDAKLLLRTFFVVLFARGAY